MFKHPVERVSDAKAMCSLNRKFSASSTAP